ncbi:MAG: hypothetical protein ACR2G5_08200 [Pyrinomonadaceae bacterium]
MANLTRTGERGGARFKFLVVVAIIGFLAYCGYLFIPVAYNAYLFRDLMQHNVDAASALGRSPDWVREQLAKSASEYGIPADAVITPSQEENRMRVRVQFRQPVEFPGYTYEYEFDKTVKTSQFLMAK